MAFQCGGGAPASSLMGFVRKCWSQRLRPVVIIIGTEDIVLLVALPRIFHMNGGTISSS